MMDAMCRLCALVACIYSEVLVPDGEKAEYRRDGKDGGVRLTFGEPEPLNGLLKEPVIYISTDAVDFSWRSVCHDQLLAAYPVYALVYYPREDEKSALLAGDFVERLAAELTAEDRWFGNIPGFIERPSADYLGFDKSTNCHKWALYFEYRRLPVPPHVPSPGDVLLRTVEINWRRDIQDTWVFDVTQFVMEPDDVDWSLGDVAINEELPRLVNGPIDVPLPDYPAVFYYAASPLPAGLAFDSATRSLTGVPTENGVTTVAYSAAFDSATRRLTGVPTENDGLGGVYPHDPPIIFTGANLAACRTARDTAFASDGANEGDLPDFQSDQHLGIVLKPSAGNASVETYLPGEVGGTTYDNTKWVNRGNVASYAATVTADFTITVTGLWIVGMQGVD